LFTGIIQSIGEVRAFHRQGADARVDIAAPGLGPHPLTPGDSVAVNGVCLTASSVKDDGFAADVSGETLARTTLGEFRTGSRVNTELPATPASFLGGHIVQGHVDGVASIAARHEDGRSVRFELKAPAELARYIAPRGSAALDGVSLTVNAVEGARFDVNIIPHTLKKTVIAGYRVGTHVNLECDIIARYLERLNA
jgi:riboflavin synthase